MSIILHNNIMKEMIKINIIKVENKQNIIKYLDKLNKNRIENKINRYDTKFIHSYNYLYNKYFIFQSIINVNEDINYSSINSNLIGITFDEKTAIDKCNRYNLIGENDFTIRMNEIIETYNLTKDKSKLYYISQKTFIDINNIKPFEFYNIANFEKL